jgi:hypothetical protein
MTLAVGGDLDWLGPLVVPALTVPVPGTGSHRHVVLSSRIQHVVEAVTR